MTVMNLCLYSNDITAINCMFVRLKIKFGIKIIGASLILLLSNVLEHKQIKNL